MIAVAQYKASLYCDDSLGLLKNKLKYIYLSDLYVSSKMKRCAFLECVYVMVFIHLKLNM